MTPYYFFILVFICMHDNYDNSVICIFVIIYVAEISRSYRNTLPVHCTFKIEFFSNLLKSNIAKHQSGIVKALCLQLVSHNNPIYLFYFIFPFNSLDEGECLCTRKKGTKRTKIICQCTQKLWICILLFILGGLSQLQIIYLPSSYLKYKYYAIQGTFPRYLPSSQCQSNVQLLIHMIYNS